MTPTTRLHVRRMLQLIAGLVAFGVGIGAMVRGTIGVPPWDVLAQGLERVTGLNFGTLVLLIGAVVLILWIPLRERPGIATVLNVLLIGPVAQIVLEIMPAQELLAVRIVLFIVGLLLVALGTGLYIGSAYGTGPRDGLMTGLNRVTGLPLWLVRTAIELTVLAIGWVLGGNVGIGTVVFAFGIGPLSEPALRWFNLRPRIMAVRKAQEERAQEGSASSTMEKC